MILLDDVAIFRLNCCDAMVPTQQKLILDENFAFILRTIKNCLVFLLLPIYFVYKVSRNLAKTDIGRNLRNPKYFCPPHFHTMNVYNV